MGGKLLFRDPGGREQSVDVAPEGVYIGRSADCAVRTEDALVSRKNCKIAFAGGRWVVEDLGSSNGTFVNEVRIQKQMLNHGDIVRCGSLQVRFVEAADSQPVRPSQSNIQVDPGYGQQQQQQPMGGNPQAEQQLRQVMSELESMQLRQEAEQNELKKLRSEALAFRDQLQNVTRQKAMAEEESVAQGKVAEELRQELDELKDDHADLKKKFQEQSEEMQARQRQLERAQDDVQRTKTSTEELRTKMADIQKTKDEGWRELNNRVAEIEHLREVINEQERILEERRIGLISFEASMKDLRAERDKMQREFAAMKSERDELRERVIKLNANIEGLEEEQRRLARAMAEGGGGGSAFNAEEQTRLSAELREQKVEVRRLESEKSRLTDQLARLEGEHQDVSQKLAKFEVERTQVSESKATSEVGRRKAEEALARAETAKQRAEEELKRAVEARESAQATADELRKTTERDAQRIRDLEDAAAASGDAAAALKAQERMKADRDKLDQQVADLDKKVAQLTSELKSKDAAASSAAGSAEQVAKLQAQLDEQSAALAAATAAGAKSNGAPSADITALKRAAEDAYTGINDALSELRTSILLAKDLAASHGGELKEAIEASMDRAEDAKGLLRSLRQVVEA